MTQPHLELGNWESDPGAAREDVVTQLPAPRIVVNRQMSEVSADAVRALTVANSSSPTVFLSGGRPVRIARETDDNGYEVTLLRTLSQGGMRGYLSRVATWVHEGQNGDSDRPPPKEIVEDLLANADVIAETGVPTLRQVVHCPVFAPDGTLHAERGYSPVTKCWYEPRGDLDVGEIPAEPSDEDVHRAAVDLTVDYLGDFAFEEDADRVHALALLLLPFARQLIPGPTPLHLVEASTPGTGKGLLAKAIFLLSYGAEVPSMTECRDEGEWSKSLTAKFATGQQVILIDNVSKVLSSAKLASALTQPVWEDRLLGGSRMLVTPVRHVFVATGNNVSMSREIVRRTVRCRMNAKMEHPWLRDKFHHDDLIAWGTENRSRLVRAALTLIRSWLVRGRRWWVGRALGSFEDWSRTVGGIIDNARESSARVTGRPYEPSAFLGNLQDLYAAASDDVEDERRLVELWHAAFGEREVPARELLPLAARADADSDSPIDVSLAQAGLTTKKVAGRIRKIHGRVFGNLEVIHMRRGAGKSDTYRLKSVGG